MKKDFLFVCFVALILLLTVSTSWSGEDKNDDQHWDDTIHFQKNVEETQTNYSIDEYNREVADEYRAESEPISHDEQSYTEVYESGEVYSEPDDNYEYLNESDEVKEDPNEPKTNPEDTQEREEEYSESDEIQTDPNEAEVKSEPEEDTGDADTWEPVENY